MGQFSVQFRPFTAVLFLFIALSIASMSQAASRPFLVVIDPGHGGSDHGAQVRIGQGSVAEKDVTLAIARDVSAELMSRGIRVALTRTTDTDLALSERTAIANRLKANVFLSLHMNSSQEGEAGNAEGVETYILNTASDSSSKRLADLENAVLEGSRAQGPDHTSGDVALIVKDLLLDSNLVESQRLACAVQNELVRTTTTTSTRYRNRGVKQALFFVLLGADMPSALVEMGFLNNPRDRALISSYGGEKRMSSSIAQAIAEFKSRTLLGRCKIIEHPVFTHKTVQNTALNKKNQQ